MKVGFFFRNFLFLFCLETFSTDWVILNQSGRTCSPISNFLLFYSSFIPVCDRLVPPLCLGRAGFSWNFFILSENGFRSHFSHFELKQKWAANPRVCRFRFTFFSVLSETVFAHIYPVMNENENERRTLRLLLDWMNGEWRFLRGWREGGMGCMVYLQGPIVLR